MLGGRRARIRTALLLVVGATAAALALVAYGTSIMSSLELRSVDTRFSLRGTERHVTDPVVVVIDAHTFNKLQLQWPFPRHLHGQVIDRLVQDGARAIAYDVQFSEPSPPGKEAEDNALIEAVQRAHGKVALAATEIDSAGQTNVFGGGGILGQIGARAGNALFQSDANGVIRRLSYKVNGLKTLGIVTAEIAEHHPITRSEIGGSRAWIDYSGGPGTLRTVSFVDVLRGKVPPSVFKGRVVVVGASAPTLQDVHPTSTSGGGLMPGAEIQASAISTALRDFPVRSSSRYVDVLTILLLALLAPLLSIRLKPLRTFGLAGAGGIGYAFLTQLAFNNGRVIMFAYPLLGLALSSVGSLAVHYLMEAFERERVRDLFSRFVPDQVVDQVLARTEDGLRLGGVKTIGTVMFTDLRGFTTFSEKIAAEEVIRLLNNYLSEMSEAILAHGGTLISYIGDGILAVFGAPIEQPDHADRALDTAREMLAVRLPRFNAFLRAEGFEAGFKMGIGLNTGPFMAGNVGSERRVEYTTIGDTTNTASRMEGMTKGTPHSLFLADSTRDALTRPVDDLVYVDELPVRGREAPIKLWTIAEEPTPPVAEPVAAPEVAVAPATAA